MSSILRSETSVRVSRGLLPLILGLALVCLAAVSPASAICQSAGKSCGVSSASNDRLCCPGAVCGWGNVCQSACRINGVLVQNGTKNPANRCQACQPSVSTTQWTSLRRGTLCRAAAGECDLAETCAGTGAPCPVDGKSLTVCRQSTGGCDQTEFCDGVSNFCPPDQTGGDTTQPGDPIVASSNNSPGSEGVANAIDNQPTKYLNFDKLNTGFTVTPQSGSSVIHCLRLTAANDAPERDPASFVLSGSNDGATYTPIASGPLSSFPTRFSTQTVGFSNNTSYTSYRLIFPTVANAAAANSMQIAEVELLCSCVQ